MKLVLKTFFKVIVRVDNEGKKSSIVPMETPTDTQYQYGTQCFNQYLRERRVDSSKYSNKDNKLLIGTNSNTKKREYTEEVIICL